MTRSAKVWLVAVVAVVLLLIVALAPHGTEPDVPAARPGASLSPEAVPTGGPSGAPTSAPSLTPGRHTALAVLATLPVKGKSPRTGYDRTGDFGRAWLDVDQNGCDTRNDILARDLTQIVRSGTCRILSGVRIDPYTGKTIDFVRGQATSALLQIDHIVPLANAWQTGAQKLTQIQRVRFANDPLNLLSVDGRANEQKSDGDAATWLPAVKAFRCSYVARQISVKAKYHLWVTPPERDAMQRILSRCPTQPAYT
ncbi:MAG: hypothetical protein JWR36_2950 [Glaciihabitans sp.]|jgi:hypothetical protein|nr:hypothetical protein [Glaciihabitans sp.]